METNTNVRASFALERVCGLARGVSEALESGDMERTDGGGRERSLQYLSLTKRENLSWAGHRLVDQVSVRNHDR